MGILRLLLAVSIVFAHAGQPFGYELLPSKTAIQTFFIISGFYMALILHEKYASKKNSYTLFITNRLLRIYPIYWIVLLFNLIFLLVQCKIGSWCFYDAFFSGRRILDIGQDVIKNIFLFPSLAYFSPDPSLLKNFVIPISWTLGIELLFYFIAPFIVKRSIKILIALTVISFFSRILIFKYNILHAHAEHAFLNTWFFLGVLLYFLFGIFSYRIYVKVKTARIPRVIYFFTTFVVIAYTLVYTYIPSPAKSPIDIVEWTYFIVVMVCLPFIFNYFKDMKKDILLGQLSYPIYVSHTFIGLLFTRVMLGINVNIYLLFIVCMSFIFSFLLWKVVQEPIDAYRQKRVSRA